MSRNVINEFKMLFLFLDGVGLGEDNSEINPFARAEMPFLSGLLGGKPLAANSAPLENDRASLVALDSCLGVGGLPQSATGQATLLTGENVPAAIGRHYGPKPNKEVAQFLKDRTIFSDLKQGGLQVAFLNAYPPGYFESIQSGRRMYAAISQAVVNAGLPLRTAEDLNSGKAISADFTASGWRTHLNLADTPILTPIQSGKRLGELAQLFGFSFFEYWLSDYAGHKQGMQDACDLLATFDQVLEGLLSVWQWESGLILITSDHGNMEDLSTRRHTTNPVPALLIGDLELRQTIVPQLNDLTDIAPMVLRFLLRRD